MNNTLDAGDFQRLGVKLQECRLTVIRRAATRAAMTLARTRETATADQWERQLSEVVTSTYRLLDPRRRVDALERAHVGRILPGALSAAGHTRFHAGPFTPTGVDASDHDSIAPMLVGDAAIIESSHHETWSDLPTHPTDQLYAQLNASDLVQRYGARRRIERVRTWMQQPRTVVGVIVALLLTSGWLLAWQRSQTPTMTAAHPRIESSSALTPTTPTPTRTAAPVTPTPVTPAPVTPAPVTPTAMASAAGAAANVEPALPADTSGLPADTSALPADTSVVVAAGRSTPTPTPTPTPDELPKRVAALDVTTPELPLDAAEPVTVPDTEPATAPVTEPEWVWWLESDESLLALDDLRPRNVDAALAPSVATPQRFAAFARDEGAAISAELRQELVTVDFFGDVAELVAIQQRVEELLATAVPGELEHWVHEVLAAAPLWYTGDVVDLQQRWQRVASRYDVSFAEYVQQTLFEATALPCSATLNATCLDQGMVAAQWLLTLNEIKAGESIARQLMPLAEQTGRGDDVKQLQSLLDAAKQAERSQKRVEERGAVESSSSSEAAIIGRHLCLVSGRWDEGLPWLAAGSDARLAAIAAHELELGQDDAAPASNWSDLAASWQAYGERVSGRGADMVQLHAVELLRRAIDGGSAIEKLRWKRNLQTLQDELPTSLRGLAAWVEVASLPLAPTGSPSTDASDAISVGQDASATAGDPRGPRASTLRPIYFDGTLVLGETSRPIGVRYQNGVVIGPAAFPRQQTSPEPAPTRFRLDCAATFTTAEAGEVRVAINVASQLAQQTVYLDDQPLAIDPLEGMVTVKVAPGEHRLRWVVDGKQAETLFLALEL